MLIVYTPADGEAEQLDIRSVRVAESSIISRNMDTTWKQVKERLADDDPEAMRMVALILKRRRQPSLKLEDFDPLVDELTVRLDKTEVEQWATEAIGALDDIATPEQALVFLQPIIDAAVDADFARDLITRLVTAPKDPADDAAETEDLSEKTEA
ncbi:hypothetical protein [Streptomyces sp. NPDC004285]